MKGSEEGGRYSDVGPIGKAKHYWNRLRLLLNSDYYSQYLKNIGVKIGQDSQVIYPSYIDARLPYLVEIGDNVIISRNVTILAHDATTAYAGDMVKVGRVIIQNHSFIGANSTILCNTTIGPNSIIGAGSVVSRDVPPDTVYCGNPARFICKTTDFIIKHRQLSDVAPFIESRFYGHSYIHKDKKKELIEILKNGPGYFCSSLPRKKPE
jgi:maltose O-acetyltransferase